MKNIVGLIVNRDSITTDPAYAVSIAYEGYKYDKDSNLIFRKVDIIPERNIRYNEIAERAIKFSRL